LAPFLNLRTGANFRYLLKKQQKKAVSAMLNRGQNRLCAEFPEIFQNYLDQLSQIVILLLDQGKNILDCNNGFLQEFGLTEKPFGTNISDFMGEGEMNNLRFPDFIPLKPPLRGAAHGLVDPQKSEINFVDQARQSHALNCCVFNLGTHYLLFGEKF
jgi:hypothetical protein